MNESVIKTVKLTLFLNLLCKILDIQKKNKKPQKSTADWNCNSIIFLTIIINLSGMSPMINRH